MANPMKPIQKAIIPIAGYGTRLFPATKAVPKALFPIIAQDGIAKPVIQLIIEEALSAGVEAVCIVAQPQQVDPIVDYFSGAVADAIREKPALAAQADRLTEIGERLHFAIVRNFRFAIPDGSPASVFAWGICLGIPADFLSLATSWRKHPQKNLQLNDPVKGV